VLVDPQPTQEPLPLNVRKSLAKVLVLLALASSAVGLTAAPANAMPVNCFQLAYMQAMWSGAAQMHYAEWQATGNVLYLELYEEALASLEGVEMQMSAAHC
jgi:hypothetical protein